MQIKIAIFGKGSTEYDEVVEYDLLQALTDVGIYPIIGGGSGSSLNVDTILVDQNGDVLVDSDSNVIVGV
jgi:hypothetical protein